jgi:hypothetical protein
MKIALIISVLLVSQLALASSDQLFCTIYEQKSPTSVIKYTATGSINSTDAEEKILDLTSQSVNGVHMYVQGCSACVKEDTALGWGTVHVPNILIYITSQGYSTLGNSVETKGGRHTLAYLQTPDGSVDVRCSMDRYPY